MVALRDALAPFAARMVREHQVLHIAAELRVGDDAIDLARSEILKWAQKRSGGRFPMEAMAGRSFELLAAGRNSAAVEVDLPNIQAWALRQEDPDKEVAGRIWTSEATLWRTSDRPPRFAARLIVGSPEAELLVAPAVPGYVRQLVDTVGLTSASNSLSSRPWYIGDAKAQEDLIELLTDPARRLPVIAFSVMSLENPQLTIDVENLSASLCGLAHVVVVPRETSRKLTEQFGKRLSVYDRAARIYMPGFSDEADHYSHPLWLGIRLVNSQDAVLVERQIRTQVAQFSTRVVRLGEDILPFAQLRSTSRKIEQDRLARSGASEGVQLSAAQERIAALEKELNEAKEIELYAVEEERKAQVRAEEAERREHNAISQIQSLLRQSAEAGATTKQKYGLPQKWSNFEEWCDQALVGRVALTGVAQRSSKKPLFSDVEQAARCLLWLADTCRARLMEGGGTLRDELVEDGIRNRDQFTFDWLSRQLSAEWHIKNGGNTRSPENCLRIYYGWDHLTQQIVVADMPAHRRTEAS